MASVEERIAELQEELRSVGTVTSNAPEGPQTNEAENIRSRILNTINTAPTLPTIDTKKLAESVVVGEASGTPPDAVYAANTTEQDVLPKAKNVNLLTELSSAYKIARANAQLGNLYYEMQMGRGTPEMWNEINRISEYIKEESQYVSPEGDSLLREALVSAAEILPTGFAAMREGARLALPAASAGALTAAALGQLGPQAALPEEVITVPGAAVLTGKTAFIAGMTMESYRIMTGLSYVEMVDEGINPEIAAYIAQGVGGFSALLETAQFGEVVKLLPGGKSAVTNLIQNSVKKLIKNKKLLAIAKGFGIKYPKFVAAETGIEVAQEAINEIGKEIARNIEGIEGGPTGAEIAQRLGQVARKTMLGTMALGFPGATTSTIVEYPSLANEAQQKVLPKDKKGDELVEATTRLDEITNLLADDFDPRYAKTYPEAEQRYLGSRDSRIEMLQQEARTLRKQVENLRTREDQSVEELQAAMFLYADLRGKQHTKIKATIPDTDVEIETTPVEWIENYGTDQQKAIYEASQNLTPEQIELVNDIRKEYNQLAIEQIMDAETLYNTRDNYTARMWDFESKRAQEWMSRFRKTTGHSKPRHFETVVEGWASGLNLKSMSFTDNYVLYKDNVVRAVENKRFFMSLQNLKNQDGSPLMITNRKKATQLGWKRIDIRNFKGWKWAAEIDEQVAIKDPNVYVGPDGTIYTSTEYYSPPEVSKALNQMFAPSRLAGYKPIDVLTEVNASMKRWLFRWGLFHFLAYARSYMLGAPTTKRQLAGLATPAFTYTAIRRAAEEGKQLIEQGEPVVKLGIRYGLTLNMRRDWASEFFEQRTKMDIMFDKAADKISMGKATALAERMQSALFDKMGPYLKVKAYQLEMQKLMKKHPERGADELAKIAARLVNEDFGGLNVDQHYKRSATTQQVMRLMLLAPDWTESNVRTLYNFFKETGQMLTGRDRATLGVYQAFWMRIYLKSFFASVLMNAQLTGIIYPAIGVEDTEEGWDRMVKNYKDQFDITGNKWTWKNFIKTPAANLDISPLYHAFGGDKNVRKYFSLLGHFQDPLKWVTHPLRSMRSKLSQFASFGIDVATRTNWRGQRFTTLGELVEGLGEGEYNLATWAKDTPSSEWWMIPSIALYEISKVTPIGVQAAVNGISGERTAFDAFTDAAGLHTIAIYPEKQKSLLKGRVQ